MIFLIDASVYVFRAYHSVLPDMRDRDGNPVHAVFGFARFLGDLIERMRPKYIAVAFDQRRTDSYRSRIYPAYKANREPAPPGLKEQFGRCREFCRLMGLAEFGSAEYEADDIIGTLAKRMRARGFSSTVVTRDKDLAQLIEVGDEFWDYMAEERFGYAEIPERFGVYPERIADFLALTGDAVDNIPGVPGVGKKTAAALLARFDSLDELYANLPAVATLPVRGAATLGAKLSAHRDTAFLARELTRIACDMPLAATPADLRCAVPDLAALGAFYDAAGFGPALRRQAERIVERARAA